MSKTNTKIIKKRKLNTADNLDKQTSKLFRCSKSRTVSVPLLYRLVYSSKLSFVTVFVLLFSFVFQGASLTYADEIVETAIATEEPTSNVSDISSETEIPVEESRADMVETSISSNDSNIDQINVDNFEAEVEIPAEDLLTGDNLVENQQGSVPDTSPPLDDPPNINEEIVVAVDDSESLSDNDVLSFVDSGEESTTTSTSTDPVTEVDEDDAGPGTDDEPLLDTSSSSKDLSEEIATTTTEIDLAHSSSTVTASTSELTEEAVTVTNSDTEFTFNRSECTTLASGSFYCLKAEADLLEDALFAAPDIDGDLEIYLVRDGVRSQVTSNQVDDAAPFFDQNSDTIVWHRLINDRYQIISYDISSGEEMQLTNGETNSMEPTRQGKYTVWQNWSNNNWNVVLFDGKEQRTITESSAHDIAPYVHGSLVVWNRYSSGQDKTIEMYDMISETYVTVDDPEGLSVTNPRMVFVYDSLHPNGDVVTKGYDMISRKFIQLDTLPRQLPDEIPESESTGETRALIQSKPSVKSDETVQNNTATSSGPIPPNLPIATSTDPLTLDLTATSTLSSEPITSPVLEIPAMVEYELIIPPLELPPVETVQE